MADQKRRCGECGECGSIFIFSERAQEFWDQHGFEYGPRFCPSCAKARMVRPGARQSFPAICSDCGEETALPFAPPRADRPIYCRNCFSRHGVEPAQSGRESQPMVAFEFAGIAGPDGQPAAARAELPSSVVVAVCEVSTELIRLLRDNPAGMRGLSPRRFEYLVAALLERQGFEIEMTPETRDGGFDMYAAQKTGLGRFLCLVECKRYCPPHKVGVSVVRSLYGVVQAKRASAGVIASTSFFSADAIEARSAIEHQMNLRDFTDLQEWLVRI